MTATPPPCRVQTRSTSTRRSPPSSYRRATFPEQVSTSPGHTCSFHRTFVRRTFSAPSQRAAHAASAPAAEHPHAERRVVAGGPGERLVVVDGVHVAGGALVAHEVGARQRPEDERLGGLAPSCAGPPSERAGGDASPPLLRSGREAPVSTPVRRASATSLPGRVAELGDHHGERQRAAAAPLLLVDLGDARLAREPVARARRRAVEHVLLLCVHPALLVHLHEGPGVAAGDQLLPEEHRGEEGRRDRPGDRRRSRPGSEACTARASSSDLAALDVHA